MNNKINYINPFHLVTISPWPLLGSLGLLLLFSGIISYFFLNKMLLLILRFVICSSTFFQWWRDVVREGEYQGFHVYKVVYILRFSFLLFIVSELFFFVSFFWSYFHSILNPPLECGNIWPPTGIIPFDPYGIPIVNSFILITSGITVTLSHHLLLLDNNEMKFYLSLTVILGLIFTFFQGLEYFVSSFTITDSVYGSLFFIITGFHGIHVIVGSLFLIYCYYRIRNLHFLPLHHVGFEAASWYWHFVDIVWLFLYIVVYWWSI